MNTQRPNNIRKTLSLLLLMAFIGLSTGCATTGPDKDPFENANRSVLKFNLKADQYILAPAARGYTKVTPKPVRNGIRNFFSNLSEPWTIVNDLLQGKLKKAGRDTGRFAINTTLGFFGFNDVASYLDLPKEKEDFGQTLAVWGVPSGPYLMLPLFGSSNVRDTGGLIVESIAYSPINDTFYSPEDTYLTIVNIVDGRSQLIGTEEILAQQADQYLFLRSAYRQRRSAQINDGQPAEDAATEDDLLDELLEED